MTFYGTKPPIFELNTRLSLLKALYFALEVAYFVIFRPQV